MPTIRNKYNYGYRWNRYLRPLVSSPNRRGSLRFISRVWQKEVVRNLRNEFEIYEREDQKVVTIQDNNLERWLKKQIRQIRQYN